jgi:hypothetical protein
MAAVCTEGFLQLALQDGTDGWLAVSTLKALQQTVLRAVTADSGPLTSAYASSESQFQSGPESSPSTTSWATRAGRKYAPAVTEAVGLATCEMLAAMCLKALVQVEYAWNMLHFHYIFSPSRVFTLTCHVKHINPSLYPSFLSLVLLIW